MKSRNKLYVFLICFAISFFIWFLIKMQKEYTAEIKYPLTYKYLPADQILTSLSDTNILVEVMSEGFVLFGEKYINRKKVIKINITESLIHKNRYSVDYFVLSKELLPQIKLQVKHKDKVVNVSPDTLYFSLELLASKSLIINPDIELGLKKQYKQYGGIKIEPSEVIVNGPYSIIDTLAIINTERSKLENVQGDVSLKIKLQKPVENNHFSFSFDSVRIFIPIEEYTEGVLEVDINHGNNTLNGIKLFPEKVKITYTVALKDYQKVTPDLFGVFLHSDKTRKKNVIINKFPAFVEVIKIEPEHVEYIILQ